MRNIPTITRNLLIINVLAYLGGIVLGASGIDLNHLFGLHFFLAKDFRLWQFITYMFMHGGFMHIAMNMFMLWMFGMVMENVWGARKFFLYYIVCGIGAGLCQELAQYASYVVDGLAQYDYVNIGGMRMLMETYLNQWTTVGASGAIYAILLAFGMTFPNERMFIIPIPVPIKAKWIIIGSVAVELFSAIGTSSDGVAHLAHLGGMFFGFILIKYWQKHPYSGYGDFGKSKGQQFFDRMKNSWENRTRRPSNHFNQTHTRSNGNGWQWNTGSGNHQRPESDWDYNARKQREQEQIDRILDKIRKSGYDSLTKDEKQQLFDSSQK